MIANYETLKAQNLLFENDNAIVNLLTEEVTWKAGQFDPRMQNHFNFWFAERAAGRKSLFKTI